MKKKPEIINLSKHLDDRGNLSVIEQVKDIPFEIKRVYWIYDVPGGEARGGHAYKENEEFIVALSGSFDVTLNDGEIKQTYSLNRSYYGLYVPKGWWREMNNFSTNAVALVLASEPYSQEDYIDDYENYKKGIYTDHSTRVTHNEPAVKIDNENEKWELNKHHNDRKGNLTVVENDITLPFNIKRVFYLYDIPGGESRGAHSHYKCHQFLIAASGSFEVYMENGNEKRIVPVNQPYQGVHIKPGIWATEQNFSSGAICLVLASEGYEAEDYIRDYNEFLKNKGI